MNKEAFARGYVSEAHKYGVDPVVLYKIASESGIRKTAQEGKGLWDKVKDAISSAGEKAKTMWESVPDDQKALYGALGGALGGAGVGALGGKLLGVGAGRGALVGAGLGGVGGAVYGNYSGMKSTNEKNKRNIDNLNSDWKNKLTTTKEKYEADIRNALQAAHEAGQREVERLQGEHSNALRAAEEKRQKDVDDLNSKHKIQLDEYKRQIDAAAAKNKEMGETIAGRDKTIADQNKTIAALRAIRSGKLNKKMTQEQRVAVQEELKAKADKVRRLMESNAAQGIYDRYAPPKGMTWADMIVQ